MAPKKFEPTAFEKRCSICYTLQDVRMGMEKNIKEVQRYMGFQEHRSWQGLLPGRTSSAL
ncbi:MAG: hypothetical protein ACE5KJ_01210 [Candidatus Zixiibacteriota bacterium]